MPRFGQQDYCEFCSSVTTSECIVCGRSSVDSLLLDLGLRLLMDACAAIDDHIVIHWLMGDEQCE